MLSSPRLYLEKGAHGINLFDKQDQSAALNQCKKIAQKVSIEN